MKKKYITPEAEMMKFVEAEEIMTVPSDDWLGITSMPNMPEPWQ